MSPSRAHATAIVVVVLLQLFLYEMWAITTGGVTITQAVAYYAKTYPWFVWVVGALTSGVFVHLFATGK